MSTSRTMRRPTGLEIELTQVRLRPGPAAIAWDHLPGDVRAMLGVAWPVVLSMLSFTAMGVVDTLFVAQLGRDELAGGALGNLAIMLVGALFVGGLRGVNVVVAQAIGAGQPALATRAGWAGVGIALTAGVGIACLSALTPEVVAAFGGSSSVQAFAAETFGIRALGGPAWLLLTTVGQAMQGRGDTRTPMVANVTANLLNIALNGVLVFGFSGFDVLGGGFLAVPKLGVFGSALATAVSLGLAGVALLIVFARRSGWARPSWAEVRAVVGVGTPIGVRFLLDFGGWATLTAMMARVGAAEVAATQVAIRVVSVSFLPGHGVGEAASLLVGQAVGAGDLARARRVFAAATLLAVAVMAAFGVAFAVLPDTILDLFAADAEVRSIGHTLLLWAAAFQVFDAICLVAMGALGGAGDTRFVMWTSVVGTWLLLVPLGWWLGVALGFGAAGVWAAVTAECAFKSALFLWRWHAGGWDGKAVVHAGAPREGSS